MIDIDAVRAQHRSYSQVDGWGGHDLVCVIDEQPWPCDTVKLLDLLTPARIRTILKWRNCWQPNEADDFLIALTQGINKVPQ
jgi:hypothetical protein